jgi:hypothetical protein
VTKGSKAFHILVPLFRKMKVSDANGAEKEIQALNGFKCAPVFALGPTEGTALPPVDSAVFTWIDSCRWSRSREYGTCASMYSMVGPPDRSGNTSAPRASPCA